MTPFDPKKMIRAIELSQQIDKMFGDEDPATILMAISVLVAEGLSNGLRAEKKMSEEDIKNRVALAARAFESSVGQLARLMLQIKGTHNVFSL